MYFLEDWDYKLINSFQNGLLGQWKAASRTQNWVNFLSTVEQMREDVSYVTYIITTEKGPCRSSQASDGKSVIYISVKQDPWIPSQRACNMEIASMSWPHHVELLILALDKCLLSTNPSILLPW